MARCVMYRTGIAFEWLSLDPFYEPSWIMDEPRWRIGAYESQVCACLNLGCGEQLPLAVLFAICAFLFFCVCACESQVCASPNLGCVPTYVYIYIYISIYMCTYIHIYIYIVR